LKLLILKSALRKRLAYAVEVKTASYLKNNGKSGRCA
jgi:hypothetical protein